jgi:hypothetical protein
MSEHRRQGRRPCCDGESRQHNAVDFDAPAVWFRQPLGVGGSKIDDQTHHCAGLVIEPHQADTAYLKETGQRRGWAHQQTAVYSFKMDAVIPDQSCEGNLLATHPDQLARELRFA